MYMKSLSVRKDKLLTQEAVTRWFEYLHKHAPEDTVSTLFVAPCPFRSSLTIEKIMQVWVLLGTFYILRLICSSQLHMRSQATWREAQ
jgi:hypothetical protein